MNKNQPFTFIAKSLPRRGTEEILYANGIFAETGLPLCELDTATAVQIAKGHAVPRNEQLFAQAKYDNATQPHYGPIGEVEPNNLAEAGWGIVFHAKASQDLKNSLSPLIEHRCQQAGALCRVFENADGYQTGESCAAWLARHGVSMMPVDPLKGVPFYLLLIGPPETIPFEFQYLLDIYWAVGRLHFDDSADYSKYAERVVAYEREKALPQSRSVAIFATAHEFDQATQMFADHVALPLIQGDTQRGALGERQKFQLQPFIGKSATKETMNRILRGKTVEGPPALLLSGSHGMGFRPDDPRLPGAQGALVCQDWAGWGEIKSSDWFGADDLPSDMQVHGLIHFFFACYGAGCPQEDDFVKLLHAQPGQIAPRPLVARLPQKLLANGALAALGHVDRAWSYSFYSSKAGPQLQGFRDVMARLLRGDRLGQATDQFDVRRAALSLELTDVLRELERGKQIPDQEIVNLWIARNDARNYIVLGDPAVRIRVEALAERSTGKNFSSASNSSNVLNPEFSGTTQVTTKVVQSHSLNAAASSGKNASAEPPLNSITTEGLLQPKETNTMTKPIKEPQSFDLGSLSGTTSFHPELAEAWREYVKQSYKRNELMFDKLLKSFMQPYWTTVWMYRILFSVGISGFIVAAVLGLQKEAAASAVFGGLSVISFLGYFISKPLRSLEQNLLFITWLGLLYNTYWVRLTYSLNEATAREDLSALQREVTNDLERLIEKHAQFAKQRQEMQKKPAAEKPAGEETATETADTKEKGI